MSNNQQPQFGNPYSTGRDDDQQTASNSTTHQPTEHLSAQQPAQTNPHAQQQPTQPIAQPTQPIAQPTQPMNGPYAQQPYAQPTGYPCTPQQPAQPQNAQQPYAQPGQNAQQTQGNPYAQPAGYPYGQQPYAQPGQNTQNAQQPQGNPYAQPQYGQPQYGQQPYAQNAGYYAPYGYPYGQQPYPVSTKSKMAAGLFGIFLGAFGVHNFYLGFTGKAVAQLLLTLLGGWFFGIGALAAGIWGLVEGILILSSSPFTQWHKDAKGYELTD